MAARFWVTGGTGNWNSTTNWSATSGGASGASVPGSADTATLNASSGSGTVTLDISPTIQTLTCTGFTGTLAFGTNTISLNSTGTIFAGATTMTVTGTPLIICTNSSATARTINATAVTEANSISFRITAGTGTLTFGAGAIRDIDFTDGTNPTGWAGPLSTFVVTIYGSLKASTGMSVSSSGNTMTFAATSGTKTINTAGVTFDRVFTFNGVGGTWQLQAALTSGATRTTTLTNGTLDLAGYTLTTGLFSSNNSNTRAIAFATGKIVLTGNSATIWTNSTGTGFTYTGTSRIEALGPATTGTRTFNPSTTATSTEATALSFYITGGSDTVSFTTVARRVNTIDFTGFTGTFTNSSITVHGNYTLAASPMVVGSGTSVTTFASTGGTKTITTNAQTLDFPITFDGIGGTWSLQDALTLGSTRTLTLTNGTLTTNGYAVTMGAFSSSNSNTRALNLGASTVTLTSTGTVWDITTATSMSLNAGTSSISTSNNTATISFAGGGLTYYNLTFGASYYNSFLGGANTFNNLTLASPAAAGRRNLNIEGSQTINGTLTAVGSAANSRPRFTGEYTGTTITAAAVSLADTDFGSIIAAGASSPWSGTRLGDFGNNTNITFATPKTVYWNQPAGGNWSDVAWATSSGGAVNINNFPLGQDTVVLDNTGVGASTTIVMDYGWLIGALSAGSLTNALTISWNTFGALAASSQGNFTLSSAITLTYTQGSLGFSSSQSSTAVITTAGVSIPMPSANFNAASKTIQLADNFTSTGTSAGLVAGTLDLNGKTLSCVAFDLTFANLEVRVLAFNGGQIDVSGNAATVWACENLTNFSYTGTPTVNFTYSGSTGTRTINNGSTAGGTEVNSVSMNITAGTDAVALSATGTVLNLNCTGYSGAGSLPGYIYGNLTLSATQTITSSATEAKFAATSGTKTVSTNGVTIDKPLAFDGVGGTWSLQNALTLSATRQIGLYAGTLNTNGYSVICARFLSSDSAATGNRTLNLGASTFTCSGTTSFSEAWFIETGTYSFTLNAGTSTIVLAEAYTGTSFQNFVGAGKTYYNLSITGGQPCNFGGNNTFNSISNSIQPLDLTFDPGTTQTVNNFYVSGTSGNLVTLASSSPGTQWSLAKNTGGKVLVSFCSITDSAATPAGYWFAPTSQGNVDGGNNTGWNFGTAGGAGGFIPFF